MRQFSAEVTKKKTQSAAVSKVSTSVWKIKNVGFSKCVKSTSFTTVGLRKKRLERSHLLKNTLTRTNSRTVL